MGNYSIIQIPEKYNLERSPKVGIVTDHQDYQYPTEDGNVTEEFMTILFSDSIEKWMVRTTEDDEPEWHYIECIVGSIKFAQEDIAKYTTFHQED